MLDDAYQPDEAEGGGQDEDDKHEHRGEFTLGEPAADAYRALTGHRESVNEMARRMAELTIPSLFPPKGYRTGDDIPGNNHSVGAQCVNTLASKLMFMAFPPGQPIAKFEPVIVNIQEQIDQDPELYAATLLALSQLEMEHRRRFESTPLETAYNELERLLLVSGNGLWKHITLDSPTAHRSDCYVVSRDRSGHPQVTIHHERPRVATLEDDVRSLIYQEMPDLKKKKEWEQEADIYSVCKLRSEDGEKTWLYWQETEKGTLIPGSEVETDYDDCPMWPAWLIPVYGDNWGRSYCEEYRGDLFSLEANASALNDGAALAAWALTFVKPGSRTSLRQVQRAKNLDILTGSAEDLSVFRSEKTADLNFVQNTFNAAARRVGAAFLLDSASRREGERVTAEEVQRVGRELDQAMGGLYTQQGQGIQRRVIMRAIKLHEEENPNLPPLPKGVVSVNVVTGKDSMGRSSEVQALTLFAQTLNQLVGPQGVAQILQAGNFATRLAAGLGVKPDGLVKTQQQMQQETAQAEQKAMAGSVLDKATGPMAGALAERLAGSIPPPATETRQ